LQPESQTASKRRKASRLCHYIVTRSRAPVQRRGKTVSMLRRTNARIVIRWRGRKKKRLSATLKVPARASLPQGERRVRGGRLESAAGNLLAPFSPPENTSTSRFQQNDRVLFATLVKRCIEVLNAQIEEDRERAKGNNDAITQGRVEERATDAEPKTPARRINGRTNGALFTRLSPASCCL
jgi:hypothetical protein